MSKSWCAGDLQYRSGQPVHQCARVDVLIEAKVKARIDGKGRWIDNRMIEGLWRSEKYECVYLFAFERGSVAKAGFGKYLTYYNAERPHSTRGILTSNEAYEN